MVKYENRTDLQKRQIISHMHVKQGTMQAANWKNKDRLPEGCYERNEESRIKNELTLNSCQQKPFPPLYSCIYMLFLIPWRSQLLPTLTLPRIIFTSKAEAKSRICLLNESAYIQKMDPSKIPPIGLHIDKKVIILLVGPESHLEKPFT